MMCLTDFLSKNLLYTKAKLSTSAEPRVFLKKGVEKKNRGYAEAQRLRPEVLCISQTAMAQFKFI